MHSIRELTAKAALSIAASATTENPISKCSECSDLGFVYTTDARGVTSCTRCKCRREAALRFGLPERFQSARLEDFTEQQRLKIKTWLTSPTDGLLLSGSAGRGKTHLACAIVRHARERGDSATFKTAEALYRSIRESFRDGADADEAEVLDAFISTPLLVLDDLGAGSLSDLERRYTLLVITERMNRRRPTIVTTNWNLDALRERFDDRIASRLSAYTVITFSGADRRPKAGE